jgi:hypothetical protein
MRVRTKCVIVSVVMAEQSVEDSTTFKALNPAEREDVHRADSRDQAQEQSEAA